jgi:hypothetical protein
LPHKFKSAIRLWEAADLEPIAHILEELHSKGRNPKGDDSEFHVIDKDPKCMGAVVEQVPVKRDAKPILNIAAYQLGIRAAGPITGTKGRAIVNHDIDALGITRPARDDSNATLDRGRLRIFQYGLRPSRLWRGETQEPAQGQQRKDYVFHFFTRALCDRSLSSKTARS